MTEGLQNKLDNLPVSPGVYLFKNEKGKIIYVGKAKVLRSRVKSYFSGISDGRLHYEVLTAAIRDLEVIVTETEIEALILEANLIKRYRPRFNVFFRDDKFFPFLRVTVEKFPQVFLTRKVIEDGSAYYGPFTEVKQVRRLIKNFKEVFQIRNCKLSITDESIRCEKHDLCLDYHIKICGGPCLGLVDDEAYNGNVRKLVSMVKGEVSGVIKELRREMKTAAEELRFEEAAHLRDRLKAAEDFAARQTIIFPDRIDRDVFGLAREDDDACVAVMRVREGRVQGREHFFLKGAQSTLPEEVMAAFIKQFYLSSDFVPRELYCPVEPDDGQLLRQWLREKRGAAVDIVRPQRGRKVKLVSLAQANAELLLGEKRRETESRDRAPHSVKSLGNFLRMEHHPRKIEAFDISNISGSYPVASLVVFKDGRPLKSEYRRFNIKGVDGINDFAMMAEAVKRRYSRLLKEGGDLPDLILVDGGKGQLSSALKSMGELEINNQPVIGLAKRLEEIYKPDCAEPLNLPKTSSALKLLQRIRDEAHRFAITHHRQRRSKGGLGSTLDNIKGVGEVRKRLLIRHFGSIKRIAAASVEELASSEGIDIRTAESIHDYFFNQGKQPNSGVINEKISSTEKRID